MESIDIGKVRELALRYIDENECGEEIRPNELFVLQVRQIPLIFSKKSEKWHFAGYHLLLDYKIDPNEKPYGKWITIQYLNLTAFPPTIAELRLQPPHIVKGYFQSFDRISEMKIEKLVLYKTKKEKEAEILQFPG
jgi:hypothetical protein